MRPWIFSEHAASIKHGTEHEWQRGGTNIVYKQSKLIKYFNK